MISKRLSALGACALLGFGLALIPATGRAQEPAYGAGIVVDGQIGDWDLNSDFFSDMFNAGRNTPNWPGFAVLSKLYLRYDCSTNQLCALVLDEPGGGEPDADPSEAWIKLYGIGWANGKLIDGNGGGNTTPRSFAWVFDDGALVGYEACARLDAGLYADFEAHLNVDGATSSTGKYAQGNAIPLFVDCDGRTVDASERPLELALGQNYPNPFNPTTTIEFSLDATAPAKLAVYDLNGREVLSLVDGLLAAGPHRLLVDGSRLSSGVYVYRLDADGRSASKKLVLVK